MPEKLDLYKKLKNEYVVPREPVVVKTKPAKYLTAEGQGAPGSREFQAAIGALYNAAYTIKMSKKFAGRDYRVCHLEGLYWVEGMPLDVWPESREAWHWKLLIRVPDFIREKDLGDAVVKAKSKGKTEPVENVKLERLEEGSCVQMLHVGPYADETTSFSQMRALMADKGMKQIAPHHEIYLSDPRRVAPEKLRTILRIPVSAAEVVRLHDKAA